MNEAKSHHSNILLQWFFLYRGAVSNGELNKTRKALIKAKNSPASWWPRV